MKAQRSVMAAWFNRTRLWLGLWVWREGWVWLLLAGVLGAAALLWALALQPARERQGVLEQALAEARLFAKRPVGSAVSAWASLDQALSQTSPPEALLKRWAAYARQRGLLWQGATLQTTATQATGFRQLQVEMSLQGHYPQWRGFAQDLLNDSPSTAIASVELSDATPTGAAGSGLQIKVRALTWFLAAPTKASP